MRVSGVMIVGLVVGSLTSLYGTFRYRREIVEYVRGVPSRSLRDLAPCLAWSATGIGIAVFFVIVGDPGLSWKVKALAPLAGMLAVVVGGACGFAIDRYIFPGPLYRRQVARLERRMRKTAEDSHRVEETEREE